MAEFTDDFNRADDTSLGADWDELTIGAGDGSYISGNTVVHPGGSANAGCSLVDAIVFGIGVFIEYTILTLGSNPFGLCFRASHALNKLTGYGVEIYSTGLELYFYDSWDYSATAGAPTRNLLASYTGAIAASDVILIRATGGRIRVYQNGILRIDVIDSSLAAAGKSGFYRADSEGTGGSGDNFQAGDYRPIHEQSDLHAGMVSSWNLNIGQP